MHIYIYIYTWCTSARTYAHMSILLPLTSQKGYLVPQIDPRETRAYTHSLTHTHTHALRAHTPIYSHTHAYTHTQVYTHTHTHKHSHTCIYSKYTQTHAHTHIYMVSVHTRDGPGVCGRGAQDFVREDERDCSEHSRYTHTMYILYIYIYIYIYISEHSIYMHTMYICIYMYVCIHACIHACI